MIKLEKSSGIFTLYAEQWLPLSLEEAWDFFSSPTNLAKITPPQMRFEITNGQPQRMYAGQVIAYLVSVIPGVRTKWVTEITHVDHLRYFVDEQRFGPYALWHHEHHFKEENGGVLMADKVSYKLPMGALGRTVAQKQISKKVVEIFQFRKKYLEERFGAQN